MILPIYYFFQISLPVDQDLLERAVHTKEEDDDYVGVVDFISKENSDTSNTRGIRD